MVNELFDTQDLYVFVAMSLVRCMFLSNDFSAVFNIS